MLIGREAEQARIGRASTPPVRAAATRWWCAASPGSAKTALLRDAIARAEGMTVLRCRALEAEADLPFAGLAELCGPVLDLRDRLPAAQAAALAGALQLEPAAPQARLAIGAALLGVLALAAEARPVRVWSTTSSGSTSRRSRRCGSQSAGSGRRASPCCSRSAGTASLRPGSRRSSSAAAPAAREVLGAVPEEVARRVLATAAGNPLALHEIPALLSHDELEGREPIEGPLPPGATLERVLASRLDTLRPDTRRALLVAAAAEVRRGDLVFDALGNAGLTSGRSNPPRRPGSSRSGRARSSSGTRCCVPPPTTGGRGRAARGPQGGRGGAARGRPQRAWQLAAATGRPDEDVAAALERAAQDARARTGFASAAHAHLRAAELSPEPVQRARRLVEAARDLLPAGHPDVGLARLEQAERVLATSESGDVSAVAGELRTLRAQLALRTGRTAEARDLPRAQARRLQDEAPPAAAMLLLLSSLGAMAMRDHRGWLTDAERALELAGDVDLLAALAALSAGAARLTLPDVATGRRLLADGEERLGDDLGTALALAPEVVALAAHGWLWIEEYERGVELLDRLVAAGRESASVGALPYPLAARAQGQLYLGRYPLARADAEEAVALAEQTGQDPALIIALGMLATVHAWHGDEDEAVDAADRAIALGERRAIPLPTIYAKHALGMLAVASEDAETAVTRLEIVRAEALPGNVLWAPHLVDAYVRTDRDATALVDHYAAPPSTAGSPPRCSPACAG